MQMSRSNEKQRAKVVAMCSKHNPEVTLPINAPIMPHSMKATAIADGGRGVKGAEEKGGQTQRRVHA
jgi:hypothetical protein